MKKKEQIAAVLEKCVLAVEQSAIDSRTACNALKELPDNPTPQQALNAARLFDTMTNSMAKASETFASYLPKLTHLFSNEN